MKVAQGADGTPTRVTLTDLLRYFAWLGTYGFGGPIATVGYMQRDLVEQRRWVKERDFLDGIALGQTMPGPLAAQVVMWVGFLHGRMVGALLAAVAFVLPSFVVVLSFAIIYVHYEGLAWLQALFYGIAPAMITIMALAALKLARLTNQGNLRLWGIGFTVMAVTAVREAELAALVIAAGLLMVFWDAPPRLFRRGVGAFLVGGWGQGVLLGAATLGTNVAMFLFFLKAGAFIFGSGLAIVPFLRAGVVEQHQWLTESQFLDAVAMGLITPGPVVISATFIGYLVGGLLGAAIATVAIFIPIYLGVVIPGPWFVRHRDNPQIKAFVKGATAAAAGAIAGATVVLSRDAIVDVQTVAIALIALVLLVQFKLKEPFIVLLAAAVGLALA